MDRVIKKKPFPQRTYLSRDLQKDKEPSTQRAEGRTFQDILVQRPGSQKGLGILKGKVTGASEREMKLEKRAGARP